MQDIEPLPWGALDRFQVHYIVRKVVTDDQDVFAKTILDTKGHFASKKVIKVSWSGGKLAKILNQDKELNKNISKQSINDASIFIEPTGKGIRIHNKWKNHIDFGVTKEVFEIYNKIAGHIKSLTLSQ